MSTTSAESGARGRTRRAIVSAAATLLARDRRATLAEIAQAAEVGRSTLHRYFADRDELVRAAVEDSLALIEQAVLDAAVDEGPCVDAMRRLVTALVATGDRLLFAFGDLSVLEELPDYDDRTERMVTDLIERGQAEGVFDPEVSAGWIMATVWAMVYTGAEAAQQGRVPPHGVAAHVIRTLEGGIRRPDAGTPATR
ncbi:TetR/AcrR family transcriptional regulator [Streptodolium elevatio]|uniref:TetR/AcrR family transcriptional regulator n=1 Tax=Streptodolium elevatio TaxID=3157996 RepID=A0ABV3DA75_9ACTN